MLIEGIRAPLLGHASAGAIAAPAIAAAAVVLGLVVFRRLSRHFEDFL